MERMDRQQCLGIIKIRNETGVSRRKSNKSKFAASRISGHWKESDDMENFVTSAVYADNKLFVTDLNWVVYEVNPQTGEMSKAFSDSSEKVNRLIAAGTEFALMTDKGIQFADAKSGALAERMQNDDVLQQAVGKISKSHNTDSNNIAMTMGIPEMNCII